MEKENIYLGFRVVPGVSNLGVVLIIIGILVSIATMITNDLSLLFYGGLFILLGLIVSFAPKYLRIDYKNKSIRHYYSWGIIKFGKTISIDEYEVMKVVKFDRTYRNLSLYHGEERRNVSYEVYIESPKENNRIMLCDFDSREPALDFAVKYGKKLNMRVEDKIVDFYKKQKAKRNTSRRR